MILDLPLMFAQKSSMMSYETDEEEEDEDSDIFGESDKDDDDDSKVNIYCWVGNDSEIHSFLRYYGFLLF